MINEYDDGPKSPRIPESMTYIPEDALEEEQRQDQASEWAGKEMANAAQMWAANQLGQLQDTLGSYGLRLGDVVNPQGLAGRLGAGLLGAGVADVAQGAQALYGMTPPGLGRNLGESAGKGLLELGIEQARRSPIGGAIAPFSEEELEERLRPEPAPSWLGSGETNVSKELVDQWRRIYEKRGTPFDETKMGKLALTAEALAVGSGEPLKLVDAAGTLLGKASRVERALDAALEIPGKQAAEVSQIVGPSGELLSTVAPRGAVVRAAAAAEKSPVEVSPETMARLPNLAKIDAPEDVIATMARTAEANSDLIDRYRRSSITHQELITDLAPRLGMTAKDFLKGSPLKALNEQELLVLRATVLDRARQLSTMAQDIASRGGVGALSDIEKADAMRQLVDAARLQAVARGAAATAGRALNQQKIRIDSLMSHALVSSNEAASAEKALAQAQAKQQRLAARMAELEKLRAANALKGEEAAELDRIRKGAEQAAREEKAALFRRQRARERDAKLAERQMEQARKVLDSLGGREVTEGMLKQFAELQTSDDPLAVARFLKAMARPSLWDRATILRYGSMLSSTATHLTNAMGNAIQLGLDIGLKPLAAGIDVARASITGGARARYLAEMAPQIRGAMEGALAGAKMAGTILKTGINPADVGKVEHMRAGFGVHPVVDFAAELPLRMLVASDAVFRGAAQGGQVRALAVRQAAREGYAGADRARRAQEIVENIIDFPELLEEADKAATRVVLQESRPLSQWMATGRRQLGEGRYVLEVVAPFVRTPTNIAAQGAGLTPGGIVGAVKMAKEGKTGQATDAAARAAFGTAVMGVATTAAAAGFLTAGYPETDAERSVLPQGWQPWSFRIPRGDGSATYVSFQNLGPIGIPLAIGALLGTDLARGKAAPTAEYLGRIAAGTGRFMLDQTFMRGVFDLVKALEEPERYAENLVENLATQSVPYGSLQRQLTRALDMGTRDPHGAIEAILAINPLTAGQVPAKQDIFGRPVKPSQTGAAAFAVPFRYSESPADPVLEEYRRLRAEGLPVGIGKPPDTIYQVKLTREEQRALQRKTGEMLQPVLQRIITSRPYQQLDPRDRATVLERLEEQIRALAAEEMALDMGREFIRRHPAIQEVRQ